MPKDTKLDASTLLPPPGGERRNTLRFSVTLRRDTMRKLEALAEERGEKRATTARLIIESFIERFTDL